MKYKNDFIFILLSIIVGITVLALTSCEPDNDTECDRITSEYMQAIQFVTSPQAREELKKQYQKRLSKAGC